MLIDEYLPRYDVVERHSIAVRATPARTFAAITTTDFAGVFVVRFLFWLRRLPQSLLRGRGGLRAVPTPNTVPLTIGTIERHGFRLLSQRVPEELVIGVEGSAGTQSATLAVRNIATGRMEGAVRRILVGEGVTGVLLGLVLAGVVGVYTLVRAGVPVLAIGAAGGTFLGMLAATLVGTLVPVTFKRVGVDPAVATGPFVTATMDLVGVVLFLGVVAITLRAS